MALKLKHNVSRILATALAVAMLGCWPALAFAEETAAPTAETVTTTETTESTETDKTEADTGVTAPSDCDTADSVVVDSDSSSLTSFWPSKPTTVTLKKTVFMRSDTYAPNDTFTFTVVPGNAIPSVDNSQPILAGIPYAVSMADDGKVKFPSNDYLQSPATSMSKTFNMIINTNSFHTVGIYHYLLSEKAGKYDGMAYDSNVRDVYVYIINKNGRVTYGGVSVTSSKDSKTNETDKAHDDDKCFNPVDYGKFDAFENTYTTNNLTVTKTLTGNQAVMDGSFTFEIKVSGAKGEKYIVKRNNRIYTVLNSDEATTIDLGDDDAFTIYGLSPNDTYSVTERGANDNGYITTFDGDVKNSQTGTISADTTVKCVNKRDVTVPTGLALDMLPYAGMVLLAVGCGIYLLRRKHEDEQ